MDETEVRRFLGELENGVVEAPSLLVEPTEISSDMNVDELRSFLGG